MNLRDRIRRFLPPRGQFKPAQVITAVSICTAIVLLVAISIIVVPDSRLTDDPGTEATTYPLTLKVLELRYFPKGQSDVINHPNTLSAQLQNALRESSRFRGYSSPGAPPSIQVEIVKVIDRNKARPNINNDWVATYNAILAEDNLCQQIKDLDIDQIWMWVDPRTGYDPNPGVEYAISSPLFRTNLQYVTVPYTPFCNGESSFAIMGFDTTRTYDLAQHSFGHYMEGLLGNIQSIELFWYRFGGNDQVGFPRAARCGNVHFPPNGAADYDYGNNSVALTACEDWNPEGTGQKTAYTCTRWGCTQGGYLTWWMQNMPNMNNNFVYQGKKIPNWWDFVVDFDETIQKYGALSSTYYMDPVFLANHYIPTSTPTVLATATPSASPSLTTMPTATSTLAPSATVSPTMTQSTAPTQTVQPTQITTPVVTTVMTTATPLITTIVPTTAAPTAPPVQPSHTNMPTIIATNPTVTTPASTPTPIPTLSGTRLPSNAPFDPNATVTPSITATISTSVASPTVTQEIDTTTPTPTVSADTEQDSPGSASLPIATIVTVVAVGALVGGLILGGVFFVLKKKP